MFLFEYKARMIKKESNSVLSIYLFWNQDVDLVCFISYCISDEDEGFLVIGSLLSEKQV